MSLAEKTNALLQAEGLEFVHLPLTKITSVSINSKDSELLQELSKFDALIFTSQSAVHYGLMHITHSETVDQICPVLAIGESTRRELGYHEIQCRVPAKANSASLAELIKAEGYQKCLILGGAQTPQLNDYLDIQLDLISVYESLDISQEEVMDFNPKKDDIILIYSLQSLQVLSGTKTKVELNDWKWVFASERISEYAQNNGIEKYLVSSSPYDESMLEAALKLT